MTLLFQKKFFSFLLLLYLYPFTLSAQNKSCTVPNSIHNISSLEDVSHLKRYPDISRNYKALKNLCIYKVAFNEGAYRWEMLLVTHPKVKQGAFWFLPHDNENSAFDSAVYAVRKYGGGFLSVLSRNQRYHQGQDPNRNFSNSHQKLSSCRSQKSASSIYTKSIFKIIDTYKAKGFPYLALHNNTNAGGISILKSSQYVKSYPAYHLSTIKSGQGMKDEDSLIYIAGKSNKPPKNMLNKLLQNGINTKYEIVNHRNNDCSMSNYVVLSKNAGYYNIETQHGNTNTQKRMIDILMRMIKK